MSAFGISEFGLRVADNENVPEAPRHLGFAPVFTKAAIC